MPRSQQGVALITVLLVTSLALLITAGMLRGQRLALHSSAQQIHQLQLRQSGFAGEAWALDHLREVGGDPQSPLAPGQAWAKGQPPMQLDNGQLEVHIEDLAGRFNITPLFASDSAEGVMSQRWLRLQNLLGVTPVEAKVLQGLNLGDISQLRKVPGIDAHWYTRMQPWIVLLGNDAVLNINTASDTLLATLEGVTPQLAKRLVAARPLQGYASVQDFTFTPALIGLGISNKGLGINSRWLRISTEVRLGQSRLRLESDVARDPQTGQWRLLQRRFLTSTHSESS